MIGFIVIFINKILSLKITLSYPKYSKTWCNFYTENLANCIKLKVLIYHRNHIHLSKMFYIAPIQNVDRLTTYTSQMVMSNIIKKHKSIIRNALVMN